MEAALISGLFMVFGGVVIAMLNRTPKGLEILEANQDALLRRVNQLEVDKNDLQDKVSECHTERTADQLRFAQTVSHLQGQIDTLMGANNGTNR